MYLDLNPMLILLISSSIINIIYLIFKDILLYKVGRLFLSKAVDSDRFFLFRKLHIGYGMVWDLFLRLKPWNGSFLSILNAEPLDASAVSTSYSIVSLCFSFARLLSKTL